MTNATYRIVDLGNQEIDILVQFNRPDSEFALDFLSRRSMRSNIESIRDFCLKHARGKHVRSVRLMIGGLVLATIPYATFLDVNAAGGGPYSMGYLYGGSSSSQIEYAIRAKDSLDTVSPSYFDLNADGSLHLNYVDANLIDSMHNSNIKVVPFLSNHWDRASGVAALAAGNMERLVSDIANAIEDYQLDGINVDIENVTEAQRNAYTELVKQLRAAIPAEKEVSVAVAANPKGWNTGWHGSYDYAALAQYADYLMIMTYDEHYEGGEPGAVASVGFVEDSIKYALTKTTADKVVLGLPFFGRIWSTQNNTVLGKGVKIDVIDDILNVTQNNVYFDIDAQSPFAEFRVTGDAIKAGGITLNPGSYVVWYENNASLERKLALVNTYGLKGAGSWALGQEPASIWTDYNSWITGQSSSAQPSTPAPTQPSSPAPAQPSTPTPQPSTPAPTQPAAPAPQPSIPAPAQPSAPAPAPVPAQPSAPAAAASSAPDSMQAAPIPLLYTVRKGDTLPKIAKSYNDDVAAIKVRNNLVKDKLKAGQTLLIFRDAMILPAIMAPSASIGDVWIIPGTNALNVRSGPGLIFPVTAKVKGGMKLSLVGAESNGFYPIQLANAKIGYVSARYVTMIDPILSSGLTLS